MLLCRFFKADIALYVVCMTHIEQFQARQTLLLPPAQSKGWHLKRYAILADGRKFDETVAAAATEAAINRLPPAGELHDAEGNHGVGFQIIHFAEQVASVSPVFYWQWGSVLANTIQMRANWKTPTQFSDGIAGVVGCVWEMQIVIFETDAWMRTVLGHQEGSNERLGRYLETYFAGSE